MHTGQISSESLLTNVEEGKGRFLFKEKPEIKNICGLFGTAGKPKVMRNQKIEKSDFNEGFTRYYGVNLQASPGGEKSLFTNIKDGSISTSTKGHYMSPNTKNERSVLRKIDLEVKGQPVKELFNQLIRDIDEKNDNTDFADDFRNAGKILGGKEVNMTKEDVFGILFVHDGGSEGKKVTGNGIIYHIYRHYIDTVSQKKMVLKKVESYFQVDGNTLKIDSGAAMLPVVQGLAKLIDADIKIINKGPIMREEIAGTEVPDLFNTPYPISERRSNSSSQATTPPSGNLMQFSDRGSAAEVERGSGTDLWAQGADHFASSSASPPPPSATPPSATPPIGTVPYSPPNVSGQSLIHSNSQSVARGSGTNPFEKGEGDPFASSSTSSIPPSATPSIGTVQGRESSWPSAFAPDPFATRPSARSSESSASSMDTIGKELNRMKDEDELPDKINTNKMTPEEIANLNEGLKYFVYRSDLNGEFYTREKIPENDIKFIEGNKVTRRFLGKTADEARRKAEEARRKALGDLIHMEKDALEKAEAQNKAVDIVKEQAEETDTVLQEMLANLSPNQQSSGGGGRVKYAITEVESVVGSVEETTPTVKEAIKLFEELSGLPRSVSSFDDKTIMSSRVDDGIENLGSENNLDRMSSSSTMSDISQGSLNDESSGNGDGDGHDVFGIREEGKVDRQQSMSSDQITPISTENSYITNTLQTASEGRDSLNTYKLGRSSGSYGTADTSPPLLTGGKRKTRRRSSKKNRKSKKVGGKKTKPKGKTKGKKIPFKKLLKKTRAKK